MGSDRGFPWEDYTPHADDGKTQAQGGWSRAGLAGRAVPARRPRVTALFSRDQRLGEEDTWDVLRYIGPRCHPSAGVEGDHHLGEDETSWGNMPSARPTPVPSVLARGGSRVASDLRWGVLRLLDEPLRTNGSRAASPQHERGDRQAADRAMGAAQDAKVRDTDDWEGNPMVVISEMVLVEPRVAESGLGGEIT
jgi:hypothetical protein